MKNSSKENLLSENADVLVNPAIKWKQLPTAVQSHKAQDRESDSGWGCPMSWVLVPALLSLHFPPCKEKRMSQALS